MQIQRTNVNYVKISNTISPGHSDVKLSLPVTTHNSHVRDRNDIHEMIHLEISETWSDPSLSGSVPQLSFSGICRETELL